MDSVDRLEINQQQLAKQQHLGRLVCHDLARIQEVWAQMKRSSLESRPQWLSRGWVGIFFISWNVWGGERFPLQNCASAWMHCIMIIIKDYCVGLFSVFLRVVFFFFPICIKQNAASLSTLLQRHFSFQVIAFWHKLAGLVHLRGKKNWSCQTSTLQTPFYLVNMLFCFAWKKMPMHICGFMSFSHFRSSRYISALCSALMKMWNVTTLKLPGKGGSKA